MSAGSSFDQQHEVRRSRQDRFGPDGGPGPPGNQGVSFPQTSAAKRGSCGIMRSAAVDLLTQAGVVKTRTRTSAKARSLLRFVPQTPVDAVE